MTRTMIGGSRCGRAGRAAVLAAALAVGVAGLTGCKPMPASGLYSSEQHTDAQITVVASQVYGTATNRDGSTATLKLDLYLPPSGGPSSRPLVILVHGGGFVGGDRSDMTATARSYARRGYVAASISYRLDSGAPNLPGDPVRLLQAAFRAIDDGMESVRWLRSNASTYRIDPNRIAMVGSSAGGAIAMGVGAVDDPTPGGPLAAYSPKIHAAVSTGAYLTPGIDAGAITFQATDAPMLLFHYDVDSSTGATAAYAKRTCDALSAAGGSCRFVVQPGSGHTTSVAAGSTNWTSEIGTFLWNKLRLFPT